MWIEVKGTCINLDTATTIDRIDYVSDQRYGWRGQHVQRVHVTGFDIRFGLGRSIVLKLYDGGGPEADEVRRALLQIEAFLDDQLGGRRCV
jgi:hypothetical protein